MPLYTKPHLLALITNLRRKDMLYDVIIIGAGVEGSATGYHLSKTNKKVLLLEQVHLCSVCVLVIFL